MQLLVDDANWAVLKGVTSNVISRSSHLKQMDLKFCVVLDSCSLNQQQVSQSIRCRVLKWSADPTGIKDNKFRSVSSRLFITSEQCCKARLRAIASRWSYNINLRLWRKLQYTLEIPTSGTLSLTSRPHSCTQCCE
jgi:hypothetical protein